jgi:hypothetical protein
MKKNFKIRCCLFIVLVFAACKQDYYSAMANKIAQEMGKELDKYDNIVIIPGSGCSGCITQAEIFFINNIHNERIKFILTCISSRKEMTIRLGKGNIEKENVFIDEKNVFYLLNYHDKIYPVIAFVEQSKITNVQLLSK